jgi:DNA polymerase-3 subunit epsilon
MYRDFFGLCTAVDTVDFFMPRVRVLLKSYFSYLSLSMNIILTRPLVFFDLETTGTNPLVDRIVSIAAIKLFPDGSLVEKEQLINPLVPIPSVASAVHGITDEMVADKPFFRRLSKSMYSFFSDVDLAGFNILKFDIPLLQAEFERTGIIGFPNPTTKVIDVQVIYHSRERRTLADAVKLYCQVPLHNAHNALVDVKATINVFKRQMQVYSDLPSTVEELHRYCQRGKRPVDVSGYLVYNEKEEVCFNQGKYWGQPVSEIAQRDLPYIDWVLCKSHYPADAKVMLRKYVYQSA